MLVGNSWIDCEGKAKARDVTMDDVDTAKQFFSMETRDISSIEELEQERQKSGIEEMDALMDTILKGGVGVGVSADEARETDT